MTVAYEAPFVPHLAFPLIVGPSGSFDMLQQDSEPEIVQSVAVLLGTPLGQRTMVPAYGVPDPTFTDPSPSVAIAAINQWEQRAVPTVTVENDGYGGSQLHVQVAPTTGSS